jgi:myxalamid-type polyketide synthase MxaE and MxaD
MAGSRGPEDALAVIGIGCRFPGGDGPDAFFRLLERGESAVSEVPASRFDAAAHYDRDRDAPGKSVSRWGAFLEDVASFDWRAFAISPREARQMDPQQRLMLEVAWEALEDAGLPLERVQGTRTGVYVGAMWLEYAALAMRRLDQIDPYTLTGNHLLFTANRISHFFDLQGPSVAMDVGCAASLTALHFACQDLWRGETDLALAGGVNLLLTPEAYVARSKAGVLSPDGRCRTFDAAASGFVPGEGAGVVVLKPLYRALEDGDRIYALVRGTAVNHNGRTPWIQAVSERSQEALLRRALERAGVHPDEVDYVELHGTGTPTGDPVEARALGTVFAGRSPERPLLVGSVKTNVGHLEAAGSIAHFIKLALSLHRGVIPASLNLESVNPEIPLEALGLEVPRRAIPWPRRGGPRTAGVTSLALGGANAHAVLQEAPPAPAPAEPAEVPRAHLLPLSARSPASLQRLAAAHAARVRAAGGDPGWLHRYCRAAALRRTHHPLRAAVAAPSAELLASRLEALAKGPAPEAAGAPPRTLFVFSGQGAQRPGMALQLAEAEPVVRQALAQTDALLRQAAGWSLLEVLSEPADRTRLNRTEVAQPALVAIQISLLALWRSWGVQPDLVMGHSLGEISAAVAAGVLDLESALRLAVLRGRLMERPEARGRMAQVRLPAAEVERALLEAGSSVSVAAVNGPSTTVIAGDPAAVGAAVRALEERGASCTVLPVEYAFHSPPLAPLAGELERALSWLRPREPACPLVSTLTGKRLVGPEMDGAYWARQMCRPVAFAAALETALGEGVGLVVEISPHPVLQDAIVEVAEARGAAVEPIPSLRRNADEPTTMREAVGAAWRRGHRVAWDVLLPGRPVHVDLPGYCWDRQHFWLPPAPRARTRAGHPLLGEHLALARGNSEHVFSSTLSLEEVPLLSDHQVSGTAVFPAAGYVEMAVQAGRAVLGEGPMEVRDLELRRPLLLEAGAEVSVQLSLQIQGPDAAEFQVHARPRPSGDRPGPAEPWSVVAAGTVRALRSGAAPSLQAAEVVE